MISTNKLASGVWILLAILILAVTLVLGITIEASPSLNENSIPIIEDQVWLDLAASLDHQVTFKVLLNTPENNPDSAIKYQIHLVDVLDKLTSSGLVTDFTPYFGENIIVVTGNVHTLRFLAGWPDVSQIKAYRPDQTWEIDIKKMMVPLDNNADGGIQGQVTDALTSDPLADIDITIWRELIQGGGITIEATATSGIDGWYSVGGLPTANYLASFEDPSEYYADEFYNNAPNIELATKFLVTSPGTTLGINAAMDIAGRISGHVGEQNSGKNLRDILVTARQYSNGNWWSIESALTDNQGNYNIGSLLPGDYVLLFSDSLNRYVSEYYDNQTDPSLANPVTVTAGATTTGIDIELGPYGWISGRITDTLSTLPIEAIDVLVYEWNDNLQIWQDFSFGNSLADGTYEAYGLLTDVYKVDFSDPLGFFESEIYDDLPYGNPPDLDSGTPVTVTVGAETTGINASLLPPTQTVTNSLTSGWNLISFPVDLENTEVTAGLSSITGTYEIIWAFDACGAGWTRYDPDVPPIFNTLENLTIEPGNWLQMFSPQILETSGREWHQALIALCQGWNLVGYPSMTPRPVEEALASIAGKYDVVFQYVAADVGNQWKKYDPNLPFGNTLTTMEPGYGYWIQMNQAASWTLINRVVPVADPN